MLLVIPTIPLILIIIASFFILIFLILFFETKRLRIVSYTIKDHNIFKKKDNNYSGIKIVFFSDIHIGKHLKKKELNKKIDYLKSLDADIYIFGGDLIGKNITKYYSTKDITDCFLPLTNKVCISVYGNHEYKPEKDTSTDTKIKYFEAMGFKILNNESFVFTKDNKSIEIFGMNDYIYHDAIIPNKKYDLVICHEGDIIDKINNQIMLSGHTHGGQIRPPLIPLYYRPINGKKYTHGIYNVNDSKLIVSNGFGYEFLKIRFNAPMEVLIIDYIK